MTYRNRLQFLLVWKARLSNKEALQEIIKGNVLVNGLPELNNIIIAKTDSVSWNGNIIQEGQKLKYLAYYKPVGIETTLNESIENNLKSVFEFQEGLFPVGRLDKTSEGLLLLTNDGHLYNTSLRKEFGVEKEYEVTVDKPFDVHFLEKMSQGIKIMGEFTLPCKVVPLSETMFRIVLVQGLNRQIRRMCYQLGYNVLTLKRLRIGKIYLDELAPGQFRMVEKIELA